MPTAYINIANLEANYSKLRSMSGGKRIIAVIKANAYGHGLCEVASILTQAEAFAVARIQDAVRLRQHGIKQRIIVLTGVYTAADLKIAEQHAIDVVVHTKQHLQFLQDSKSEQKIDIWLKVDTGMHRLGFFPDEVAAVITQLQALPQVSNIRLLSHFATAEDIDNPDNLRQIQQFANLPALEKSFANSAAFINYPDLDADWPRIGLLLYGVLPSRQLAARATGFKPVMTLKASVIAIKQLQRGDKIGYGAAYICPEDMSVAVIGIGYGDGYPRELTDDAYCLINGARCKLLGRVSMDMLCVDISSAGNVHLADEAEMWGDNLSVAQVADWARTIPYRLLAGLTASVYHCITN